MNLRVRGTATPPPTVPPRPEMGLDIAVDAPGRVFVRGHGLDAEMAGRMQIGGTTAMSRMSGGFDMRRGTFSFAGKALKLTRGRVGFSDSDMVGEFDPTLNFAAESSTTAATVTLTVSGHAEVPKIAISSVPELPQDEALAQLLFGQSMNHLTPFQLAAIGQAAASLTGVDGGLDPLAAVRKTLGLDRLSAGSGSGDCGMSLQVGKYVADGVYVGAQQSISGGTRAQVQIDLSEHLKLDTVIGTGGAVPSSTTTPDNDPGSSLGLTYQMEY